MINKKICMLGAFSVGKTSLVSQYVHSIFKDAYLSTVGVKISKKELVVDDTAVSLVLWDMEGKDDYANVNITQLRGAMGFFTVADITRLETLDIALSLREQALLKLGPDTPNYILLNKADLKENQTITQQHMDALQANGISLFLTSAKTGLGVEEAFLSLARQML